MPDIFAGEPFPLDQFPPKDMSVIMEFFGRVDPLTPPAVEKVRCGLAPRLVELRQRPCRPHPPLPCP